MFIPLIEIPVIIYLLKDLIKEFWNYIFMTDQDF